MVYCVSVVFFFFFFQAEDGIRDADVTGVQTCALPICLDAPDAALRVLGGLLDLVKDIHGNAGLAADRDEPLPPAAQLEEQGGAFLARHAEPAPTVRELALAGRDLLREIPHPLHHAPALDR